MSFLQRNDPSLFARFQLARQHDQRLIEVFEDLESVAEDLERGGGRSAVHVAGIVAELTEELRQRVAAWELKRVESKEKE